MGLAGEDRGTEGRDDDAAQCGGDDRGALCRGEDLLPEAERHDGGGDAELGGRDEGSRRALATQPSGGQWMPTLMISRAAVRRSIAG